MAKARPDPMKTLMRKVDDLVCTFHEIDPKTKQAFLAKLHHTDFDLPRFPASKLPARDLAKAKRYLDELDRGARKGPAKPVQETSEHSDALTIALVERLLPEAGEDLKRELRKRKKAEKASNKKRRKS